MVLGNALRASPSTAGNERSVPFLEPVQQAVGEPQGPYEHEQSIIPNRHRQYPWFGQIFVRPRCVPVQVSLKRLVPDDEHAGRAEKTRRDDPNQGTDGHGG